MTQDRICDVLSGGITSRGDWLRRWMRCAATSMNSSATDSDATAWACSTELPCLFEAGRKMSWCKCDVGDAAGTLKTPCLALAVQQSSRVKACD